MARTTAQHKGHDFLGIYLNDHLAGATGGVGLARRMASAADPGSESARVLSTVAAEITQDRAALIKIMSTLGIRGWRLQQAGCEAFPDKPALGVAPDRGEAVASHRLPAPDHVRDHGDQAGGEAAGRHALVTVAGDADRLFPDAGDAHSPYLDPFFEGHCRVGRERVPDDRHTAQGPAGRIRPLTTRRGCCPIPACPRPWLLDGLNGCWRSPPASPAVAVGAVGRLEAQSFVHRHCPAARVDRHAKGSEACRMLRGSLHECRADTPASLLRHDEDALDVCGQPTCRSRSRHARDQRDPGHADDLRSEDSSHERQVRVLAGGPPLREPRCE